MALIHMNFYSWILASEQSCDIILPQYHAKQADINGTEKRHPVLWLLHGKSDDHTAWQRKTSVERYASSLGLAVVMPSVQISSYADMAHGAPYYTFISKELPNIMCGTFPLSAKREDNFIAGLSMGGFGSLKIGLANPDKYAAIGCLSAGTDDIYPDKPTPETDLRGYIIYGDRELEDTEEDVRRNAKKIIEEGLPAPRIYHSCGDHDFLLDSAHDTRDFFNSFEGNPFGYTYEEDPGAHTWEYWDEHIKHFLEFTGLPRVHGIL